MVSGLFSEKARFILFAGVMSLAGFYIKKDAVEEHPFFDDELVPSKYEEDTKNDQFGSFMVTGTYTSKSSSFFHW